MNTPAASSRSLREWLQLLVERESTPETKTGNALQAVLPGAFPRSARDDSRQIPRPNPALLAPEDVTAAPPIPAALTHLLRDLTDAPATPASIFNSAIAGASPASSIPSLPALTSSSGDDLSSLSSRELPTLNSLFSDLRRVAPAATATMPADLLSPRLPPFWSDATPAAAAPDRWHPAGTDTADPAIRPTNASPALRNQPESPLPADKTSIPGRLHAAESTPPVPPLDSPLGYPQFAERSDNHHAWQAELARLARRLADLETAHGAG